MKKVWLYAIVCVSLIVFVNASVWEGAAAASSKGELPDSGLFIATNAFPVNTMVEVTNLDNGKTVRVMTSTHLDAPGLLAMLSKDASDSIGLPARALGRIRISQTDDPAVSFKLESEFSSSNDPDYNPALFVAMNGIPVFEERVDDGLGNHRTESGELIVDLPESARTPERTHEEYPSAVIHREPEYDLSLVPAEIRPPEKEVVIDESHLIPGIAQENTPEAAKEEIDPNHLIEAIPEEAPRVAEAAPEIPPEHLIEAIEVEETPRVAEAVPEQPPEYTPPASTPPQASFSVPRISSLERGKYYVQIAAYSKIETVESELAKIDYRLPRAVMSAGSPDKPVYRILIGPLNLGESGALLQRFKLDFKDAFVRQGS